MRAYREKKNTQHTHVKLCACIYHKYVCAHVNMLSCSSPRNTAANCRRRRESISWYTSSVCQKLNIKNSNSSFFYSLIFIFSPSLPPPPPLL